MTKWSIQPAVNRPREVNVQRAAAPAQRYNQAPQMEQSTPQMEQSTRYNQGAQMDKRDWRIDPNISPPVAWRPRVLLFERAIFALAVRYVAQIASLGVMQFEKCEIEMKLFQGLKMT